MGGLTRHHVIYFKPPSFFPHTVTLPHWPTLTGFVTHQALPWWLNFTELAAFSRRQMNQDQDLLPDSKVNVGLPQHLIHLFKLPGHFGVIWSVSMTTVINTQKVRNQHIPIMSAQLGNQMFKHSIVNSIQILNVERRKGIFSVKSVWKQTEPRVVSKECDSLVLPQQMINPVVLSDLGSVKIGTSVHECWKTACRQAFQSLHGCCWGVGHKFQQPWMWRLLREQLVDWREFVLVRKFTATCGHSGIVRCKIMSKRINDQDNRFVEPFWDPTTFFLRPVREIDLTGAVFIHDQPLQKKPFGKQ